MSLRPIAFSSLRTVERLLRGRTSPAALDTVDEFLILSCDSALGTAVHAEPVLEALRTARPKACITAAGYGIALEVLRNNPFADRVIEIPNPYTHTLAAARKIRGEYKPERLFCIVTANGSSRSRIALLALLIGKALRIGFTQVPELYDAPLSPICKDSQIARNLRALQPLGIHIESLEPRLFFTATDLAHAQALAAGSAKGSVILVTRTSGGQLTAWPQDRFVEVARHLIRAHGLQVLLAGTVPDAPALQHLAQSIGQGARSIAGQTTVSQLAALCAVSDIAITLDTGGLHVARSQQLPLAVIAPAWQDSVEWMPVHAPWARILKGPWFPAPPPPGYAIEEVATDAVIAAADDLLHAYPPSASARDARIRHSLLT